MKQATKKYFKAYYLRHKEEVKARKLQSKLETQRKVFRFLTENPCVDCTEANPLVLDFDHIDNKSRGICEMINANVSWKRVEAEIKKCVVRCRKCHAIKTHREQNTWRWKMFNGSLA